MIVSEMLVAISKLPPALRDVEPLRAYVLSLPARQDAEISADQVRKGRALILSMENPK